MPDEPMKVSTRMRTPFWALCLLCGLCLPLGGCLPFMLPVHSWPGPRVVNRFAADVDVEIRLTDGTVRRGSYKPCNAYNFFDPQPLGYERTVFLERLIFRRDDAVIGDYEGAKVEALGARGGRAVLDGSGLRRLTGRTRCSRVFNTLTTDVRLAAVYADGSTASLSLRPCEPYLWTGLDPLRDKELQADDAGPTRLTVTRGGDLIHELDERAIRKTFKRHLRLRIPTIYAIGESAIVGREGVTPPRSCLRRDAGSAPAAS